jgi:amino acid adenylation domain-containing protein
VSGFTAGHLLWHRVRDQVAARGHHPAVRDGSATLTYAELWDRSGRAASWLAAQDIGRGDRVGMLLPKSVDCVVAMLAVLRTGAAYVPVDPRAPASRAAFVLRNAAVRAVVARPELFEALGPHAESWRPRAVLTVGPGDASWAPDARVARLEDLPAAAAPPLPPNVHEGDPAYILYTSGSTGTPKGVVISHRNALTFVEWGLASFGLSRDDILSNHAPFHFDLSVFDVYCALHAGATVSIVPDRLAPFPAALARWIRDERISIWYSVPSALVRLLKQGRLAEIDLAGVRAVLFAGEVFPVKYLREVMDCFPRAGFHNLFGPTETNVCTWYEVPRPLDPDVVDLPIGHGCANMDAIVLRDDGGPAGPGEEGELLIGGPGVMLGYWGLPDRTAAVRVQNPLHANFADPVHRTGDRVRVRPDGGFLFLGRRDHMVKTRGYRVELGEIEAALHAHATVRSAVVAALPDDDIGARLAAVVEPEEGGTVDLAALTAFLLEKLPRYAVPEEIRVLPQVPVTSTGKADRTAVRELFSRSPTP